MRSYFFSADTQEDMLGWVRALSQSAAMEPNGSLNRSSAFRCDAFNIQHMSRVTLHLVHLLNISGAARVIRISHR